MGKVEDDYYSELQTLESFIHVIYSANETMRDSDVERALEALIRTYNAQLRKRNPPTIKLNDNAQHMFDAIESACEWLITGESPFESESGEKIAIKRMPIGVDEVILCLKRIRKSVQRWSKQGGRTGYYDFICQFFGDPRAN